MATQSARRTQAERTAETRARIMDAVVGCIADVGFGRATASEITRRAGVTWGAVQHHFGDKDGILRAVLEDSFERFAERLEGMPGTGASVNERVDAFINCAWSHFGSADYQSTFEILLQVERARAPGDLPTWQSGMSKEWSRIWQAAFADARLSRRESLALQRYTVSVLTGIASMRVIGGGGQRRPDAELDLLKDALSRSLQGQA